MNWEQKAIAYTEREIAEGHGDSPEWSDIMAAYAAGVRDHTTWCQEQVDKNPTRKSWLWQARCCRCFCEDKSGVEAKTMGDAQIELGEKGWIFFGPLYVYCPECLALMGRGEY